MEDCMEVMVKPTKEAFKTIVKDRLFTEEAISTFLTEVESIISSLSLTPTSDNIDNLESITPNRLLLAVAHLALSEGRCEIFGERHSHKMIKFLLLGYYHGTKNCQNIFLFLSSVSNYIVY